MFYYMLINRVGKEPFTERGKHDKHKRRKLGKEII